MASPASRGPEPSIELRPERARRRNTASSTSTAAQGSSSWDYFKDLAKPGTGRPRMYKASRRTPSTGPGKLHPYDPDPPDASSFTLRLGGVRVDRDYYAMLGVPREACLEQIEWAYRRAVRVIHPDLCYLDQERRSACDAKLRILNGAMQVLRDPQHRACYDAAWRRA